MENLENIQRRLCIAFADIMHAEEDHHKLRFTDEGAELGTVTLPMLEAEVEKLHDEVNALGQSAGWPSMVNTAIDGLSEYNQ